MKRKRRDMHSPLNLEVCGVKIGGNRRTQFGVLAVGALISGVALSLVQEELFHIPGFSYTGWMTFLTYVSWLICGRVERLVVGASPRKGAYKDYALISVLTFSGVYFTNLSLNYINYATRIIVKSCKVLPVMLVRVLIQGKRHTTLEYFAALLLVTGISLFTLGDKEGYPEFSFVGVMLIAMALVCDALTSNLEERWLFDREDPCSQSEVVFNLSIFSALYALGILVATDEAIPAIRHSLEHKAVVPLVFVFSVMGYVGVEFVLLLIQNFGATNAEIVKSSRRVLQVSLSFLIFPKPFTWKHGVGATAVLAGLFWYQQIRSMISQESNRKNHCLEPHQVAQATDLESKIPLTRD